MSWFLPSQSQSIHLHFFRSSHFFLTFFLPSKSEWVTSSGPGNFGAKKSKDGSGQEKHNDTHKNGFLVDCDYICCECQEIMNQIPPPPQRINLYGHKQNKRVLHFSVCFPSCTCQIHWSRILSSHSLNSHLQFTFTELTSWVHIHWTHISSSHSLKTHLEFTFTEDTSRVHVHWTHILSSRSLNSHLEFTFTELTSWVHIHWTHIMSSHCNVAAAFPPQFHSPPQFHLNQAAILHKSHWFHICYAILVHENLIQYILKTDISPGWPSHFCWFARGYNVSAVTRVLSLNQKEICFKTGFNLAVSTKTPTVEIAEWGAHWSGTRDSFCGTECYLC